METIAKRAHEARKTVKLNAQSKMETNDRQFLNKVEKDRYKSAEGLKWVDAVDKFKRDWQKIIDAAQRPGRWF